MPGAPFELCWSNQLNQRRMLGDWGEDLALRYLMHKGYTPVERNYRTPYGEIDLIVCDERTLIFVEVKLRRGMGFGDPLEAVTPRKQAKIRLVAQQYLAEKGPDFVDGFDEVRFDAVGILREAGTPKVRHVEDAF